MFCIITHTSGRIWLGQIFSKMNKFEKKKYFEHLHNGGKKIQKNKFHIGNEMHSGLFCVNQKQKSVFGFFVVLHQQRSKAIMQL